MSVREIIQKIEALSPEERREVAEFLKTLPSEGTPASGVNGHAVATKVTAEPGGHGKITFEEAVDIVFRDNAELLLKLAQ